MAESRLYRIQSDDPRGKGFHDFQWILFDVMLFFGKNGIQDLKIH